MYSIAGITSSRVLHDSLLKSILGKYVRAGYAICYTVKKNRKKTRHNTAKQNRLNSNITDKINDTKNEMEF